MDWNFNPRTREGCDVTSSNAEIARRLFQSTHPRGVRLDSQNKGRRRQGISIHAPARGATPTCRTTMTGIRFQSTHPRGVRRPILYKTRRYQNFNPRTREGCDPVQYYRTEGKRFQSTHPRGVRPPGIIGTNFNVGFQSTHPRGVRPVPL